MNVDLNLTPYLDQIFIVARIGGSMGEGPWAWAHTLTDQFVVITLATQAKRCVLLATTLLTQRGTAATTFWVKDPDKMHLDFVCRIKKSSENIC